METYTDLAGTIVSLPCSLNKEEFKGTSSGRESEPVSLDLTGADLCQNTMFVGTLGSGKTTSMNTMLRQLISYRSTEDNHKLGLLIFDSKMDETVQKVTAWAIKAGRLNDLMVVSPTGDHYYELFQNCDTLTQIEEIATKLLSCSSGCGKNENAFWENSRRPIMLMGLVLALVKGKLTFSKAMKALQSSIVEGNTTEEDLCYEELKQMAGSGVLSEADGNMVNQVMATYQMWKKLDGRTKGNHTQIFSNNLEPLLSSQAQNYFLPDGGAGKKTRKPLNLNSVISQGKIVVVAVNAVRYPELASLIGKLVKADFYDAVQARQLAFKDHGRLVGLILDEYPLVVTGTQGRYGDVTQLQSMRSKRAFVVAATQGFTSIDLAVGYSVREGLTLNFNNWFIMKSNEDSVRSFISSMLPVPKNQWKRDENNADWWKPEEDDDHIKPSNLAVNQAYVALTRLRAYKIPLWLKPDYFDGKIAEAAPEPSVSFHEILQKVKEQQEAKTAAAATEAGLQPTTTDNPVTANTDSVKEEPHLLPEEEEDVPIASDPFISQRPQPDKSPTKPAAAWHHSLWELLSKRHATNLNKRWHVYLINGESPEIVSPEMLHVMIQRKIITSETLVSSAQTLTRLKAGNIDELKPLFLPPTE